LVGTRATFYSPELRGGLGRQYPQPQQANAARERAGLARPASLSSLRWLGGQRAGSDDVKRTHAQRSSCSTSYTSSLTCGCAASIRSLHDQLGAALERHDPGRQTDFPARFGPAESSLIMSRSLSPDPGQEHGARGVRRHPAHGRSRESISGDWPPERNDLALGQALNRERTDPALPPWRGRGPDRHGSALG
jgi:hypothetical protein